MSALTRRRDPDAHHETWLIRRGDVHIGTIRTRAGVPGSVDQWGWTCGFYPASHRGVSADGTAMSFEAARADFEAAWCRLLSKITEADFDDYRRNRAWTTWLCAMFDSGCMLPTQVCDSRSRCFCGGSSVSAAWSSTSTRRTTRRTSASMPSVPLNTSKIAPWMLKQSKRSPPSLLGICPTAIGGSGLIQFLVVAVSAGIGAYFSEYLKMRGKNLATREDFENLKAQLRENTELVENIKADIWAARLGRS